MDTCLGYKSQTTTWATYSWVHLHSQYRLQHITLNFTLTCFVEIQYTASPNHPSCHTPFSLSHWWTVLCSHHPACPVTRHSGSMAYPKLALRQELYSCPNNRTWKYRVQLNNEDILRVNFQHSYSLPVVFILDITQCSVAVKYSTVRAGVEW